MYVRSNSNRGQEKNPYELHGKISKQFVMDLGSDENDELLPS